MSNKSDGEDPIRAAINEYNPDGTGHRIFASGLRYPVALTLQPGTNTIWTSVNERDTLGDDLVPDYITSVKDGGFYGWPYSYIGNNYDPEHKGKRPDLVARAIVPDVLIPAHSAAVGLTFYTGTQFPERYRNGAFIGLHGSWNRSKLAGYRISFVPFQNGKPAGPLEDFVKGWILNGGSAGSAWGRSFGAGAAPVRSKAEASAVQSRVRLAAYTARSSRLQGPSDAGGTADVAYFFQCNGAYESSSLRVRARLQDLFARWGYYAKVELMTQSGDSAASLSTDSSTGS